MESNVGSYPSYSWKSIWCARGLLEQGIGWRVGSGHSINIWNDAWIVGQGNGRVNSVGFKTHFSKVSDLIDQDTCSWKEHIVRQLFTAKQADRILCMPLSSSASTDSLIWRCNKSGLYSIHSGYNFLINSSPELDEESDHQSANRNKSFSMPYGHLRYHPKLKPPSRDL
ncbi:hypothetical protein V6N11_018487 [Hibiscus sabdariffa]|uniref:Reverse transcriptase-like protein n=1 Tax=Hibiscus sabdariffa TaxID=183260 RepID=A0ABR2T860_9ROSI